jgi:hypothetical protein
MIPCPAVPEGFNRFEDCRSALPGGTYAAAKTHLAAGILPRVMRLKSRTSRADRATAAVRQRASRVEPSSNNCGCRNLGFRQSGTA